MCGVGDRFAGLGVRSTDEVIMRDAIEEQVRLGRKIQAIKIYREATSSGLRDAKLEVEHFMAKGRWSAAANAQLGDRQAAGGGAAASAGSSLAEAEALARAGKKIYAIKELRRVTGLGLKDAKDAVEAFMRGGWPATLRAPEPAPVSMTAEVPRVFDLAQAEQFARAGKKIHAIKAFKEVTGFGLKECKQAVEAFLRGGWPAELLVASTPPAQAPAPASIPAPTPASAAPRPKVTKTASPKPKVTKTAAAKPTVTKTAAAKRRIDAPAEDVDAIIRCLGVQALDQLYEVEKDFARGYLALVGERAHFVAKRFGEWAIDETYARADGVSAEVRTSLSRVELRLRKTFIADAITGLDEATARAVARLLDPQSAV
ncbi:MAG: ribosomal protein L7/L12 [Nannocystaceae bacterium]